MVSNLDRALNRVHRQSDVIFMGFGHYFTNYTTTGLEDLLTSGPLHGSERYLKVVLDGQASDPVRVLSGVPQGSVLGPFLFLIINDLPENIRSSVRLFTYDCILYRNINSLADCQILQRETDWQMKFNVAKWHSMRVTRHFNQIHYNFTLHQQTLEQVRYLGLTITDNLEWGQHVSKISCKAT